MVSSWTQNIAVVQRGLVLRLAYMREAIKKAVEEETTWYVRAWIILKYLTGRPGLIRRTGRAQRSWHSIVKISKFGITATMTSRMPERFNYLKAHQDPQMRKAGWIMPKRLNILEDWGTGSDHGPGAKLFTRNVKSKFAEFAKQGASF